MLGVEREVCVDGWMRGRWFLAGVIGYGWRLSIGGVGVYGYTTLQLGFIQLWYGWGGDDRQMDIHKLVYDTGHDIIITSHLTKWSSMLVRCRDI